MNDQDVTSAFYAARPVLSVDGRDCPGLESGLISLLVEETNAGLYRCELIISNWGASDDGVGDIYLDRELLDFGRAIIVEMGDGDAAAKVFEGRITGIEASYIKQTPPQVTVLAEDRFQDMRMTRRTRAFENVNDRDVMEQLASQHSLMTDIDIDAPSVHKVLVQVNQSDLAFIRERARAIDAEMWVEEDVLYVQSRRRRKWEDVSLTLGDRLEEFSVLADLAGQCTSLGISGWNVDAKEAISVEATEAAISDELGNDQSGSDILRAAFGERKEQLVHTLPLNDEEARYIAQARYRRTCRQFVTGTGTAEGDGRIRVGSHVDLEGLGTLFDGKYYVVEVRHTFDGVNGYRTHFRVERPGVGQ